MAMMNLESLLSSMTLDEKISLLAGANFWETVAIPRLNVPSLKMTDGPNGARGATFVNGPKAACFPASVLLAATFDESLVRRIGHALADEAKTKGASLLLAPTVCLHRSPLGGRNFESFSEDPFLAGNLASSYIKGLQENGIGGTIKHFAANEQETRRFTMNANIDERTLREIYLKPFEIAIKSAKPWAVMTSYNLVNGVHADMNEHLLQKILKEQWGFEGLVVSDWGGTNSTAESITAGLHLEMPGPANKRNTAAVKFAIDAGTLQVAAIDSAAKSILKLLQQAGKFENPETLAEVSINLPQHQALIREAGGQGIVLLKNRDSILPLNASKLKTVAALGLAKECLAHGGGSARVNSHYGVTPLEALENVIGKSFDIRYAQGAPIFRNLPDWKDGLVDSEGKPGLTISRFDSEDFSSAPMSVQNNSGGSYGGFGVRCAAAILEGEYHSSISGSHYVSFMGLGPSKLYINNEMLVSLENPCVDPMGFLLGGVVESEFQYQFEAGNVYKVRIETIAPKNDGSNGNMDLLNGLIGCKLGFMLQKTYEENLLDAAVEAAKGSDIALIFVGNTPSWETEGQDQVTMSLPAYGSLDRLINAVCAVNPNVVVINSTGVAIEMPWLDKISGLLQVWYGGQESGNSIVDVLFGEVNPGGKLPVTFPTSLKDTPTYENFPGDTKSLQVYYKEGINIGYRHYDRYPEHVLFPFGFGLSYTQCEINALVATDQIVAHEGSVVVSATVKNIGSVAGSEVVQVYIASPVKSVDMPPKQLAGYAKVFLGVGESKTVDIEIGYQSAAYWSTKDDEWMVEKGEYDILVGNSAQNTSSIGKFGVADTFTYPA